MDMLNRETLWPNPEDLLRGLEIARLAKAGRPVPCAWGPADPYIVALAAEVARARENEDNAWESERRAQERWLKERGAAAELAEALGQAFINPGATSGFNRWYSMTDSFAARCRDMLAARTAKP